MGPWQRLWYALSRVSALKWSLLERRHTVYITGIRPVLKEQADRREDKVRCRICLVERPVRRVRARSNVLLEGLLVGCGTDRGCSRDDQETRPIAHVGWVRVRNRVWNCGIGYLQMRYQMRCTDVFDP